MKIKLLLPFLLSCITSSSQHQVNSFYGTNGFVTKLVATVNPLNHGAGGADQAWTFGSFVLLGNTTYSNVAPTAGELTTYPGTTTVISTSSVEGSTTTEGKMFTKNAANTVSITGLDTSGLVINFNGTANGSSNATLGAFPMTYPFTNTDNTLSGNYTYTTYSGTFTGTLTTSVDGYGVLNLPDYNFSGNVTRLKTVLSISLNYGFFTGVGTVTQTSYSYYNPSDPSNNFYFRSVNTTAVVALAGINQNTTTLEVGNLPVLSNGNLEPHSVWIANPVGNSIEIHADEAMDHAAISVTDILGKTIYRSEQNIDGLLELPVALRKGIYFVKIDREGSSITRKIIKN